MSAARPRPALAGRSLYAPKQGNTEAEYEDAFTGARGPGNTFTVAVSDGASSAVFARPWARLLVEAFANTPFDPADVWKRISELGQRWRREVSNESLPWYAQEKLGQGSSASLLVATWDLGKSTWKAHAVGDSCLFLIRGDRLVQAFPVAQASAFDNSPDLLSTEVDRISLGALPAWKHEQGSFEAGDLFLLMTDALAAWFLGSVEKGRQPWKELPEGEKEWLPWLQKLRDDGSLKNDDVTVVEMRVTAG